MIKSAIRNIIKWAVDVPTEIEKNANQPVKFSQHESVEDDIPDPPLRFQIIDAIGGKVVKVQTYNEHTGSYRNTLYIITENDNFGDEISQIITRELLSR